jgi:hypothetical protein
MKGPVLILLLVSLAGPEASAAPIYRCGNTYSQMRCTGGQVLESTDPRSAAQRAEARRVAERQQLNAARMEAERREREAAMKPAVASGFDSRESEPAEVGEPHKPKRKSAGRKGKKEDAGSTQDGKDFVAVEPRKRQ